MADEGNTKSGIASKAFNIAAGAAMAVASCVVVHAGFDFIALAGGPNFWDILVNPVTDGMTSIYNGVVTPDPASLAATPTAPATSTPTVPATQNIASLTPITGSIPDGCHTHLNGDIHCGSDNASPEITW